MGERRRSAGPHELRARPRVGPLSQRERRASRPRGGRRSQRARGDARSPPGLDRHRPGGAPDARRADGPAERAADHAAVAGRPRSGEYRRRQARRARDRLAGVPAAVSGEPGMITRRTFVKAGGCALVAYAGAPRFLLRTAHAAEARGKVLVAVFQRGAVDGLSMVMPHGDAGYTGLRPSIALQPPSRGESERAVDLDGFFALHPSLAPLVPLWENRSLAVVHACGSHDTTRSHFDAQDYMESGTPGVKSTPDGWLARATRGLPAKPAPFRAVALGPVLPRTLQGDVGAISMQSIDRFDVRSADASAGRGFESLYDQGVRDLLHGTGRETFEAVKMLRSANAARITPANAADYPRGPFGDAMRQIAPLIKANVGL